MEYAAWQGYRLSRLMLGTVQLGMPYGIANCHGQPDYQEALSILKVAIEGGVNCFDTAAAYGRSEETLGRALHELGGMDQALVVTKIKALTSEELANPDLAERAIEQSVIESQKRLRLDCLPLVLFHREEDALYLHVLEKLRERGLLRHFGVSCDNRPGTAEKLVASGGVTALQIPGNVVDRRHQASGIFRITADRSVATFLRSVYLQGLLVMPEEKIPTTLREVVPIRRTLNRIAADGGITLAELALRYMLTQEGITSVLTGVETAAQLRDNLAMFQRGVLSPEMVAAVDAVDTRLDEAVVTPWMWPKLADERTS